MQQYKNLVKRLIDKYDTTLELRQNRTGIDTVSVFGHQDRYDLKEGFPLLTLKYTSFKLVVGELLWFLEGSTDDRRLRELSEVAEGKPTIWSAWAVDSFLSPESAHTTHARIAISRNTIADKRFECALDIAFEEDIQDQLDLPAGSDLYYPKTRLLLDRYNVPYPHDLGCIYQKQWLSWGSNRLNQLSRLIESLKTNPYSRRHVVSAWNVDDLPDESLSPQENVKRGKMALAPCHTLFQFYVEDKPTSTGVMKKHLSCQLYQR